MLLDYIIEKQTGDRPCDTRRFAYGVEQPSSAEMENEVVRKMVDVGFQ